MDINSIKRNYGILGKSIDLNRAIDIAVQVSSTDITTLVTGESGTGKENIPKIIHSLSNRKHENFISVNCGAIPEGTIDSELFGHVKGALLALMKPEKDILKLQTKELYFWTKLENYRCQLKQGCLEYSKTENLLKLDHQRYPKLMSE